MLSAAEITKSIMSQRQYVWQFLKPLSKEPCHGLLSRQQALEIVEADPYGAWELLKQHKGEILAAARMRARASQQEPEVISELHDAWVQGNGNDVRHDIQRPSRPRG